MFTLIKKVYSQLEIRRAERFTDLLHNKWDDCPVLKRALLLYDSSYIAWLSYLLFSVGAIVFCWIGMPGIAAVLTAFSLQSFYRTRNYYTGKDIYQDLPVDLRLIWDGTPAFLEKEFILDIVMVAGILLLRFAAGKTWLFSVLISVNGAMLFPKVARVLCVIIVGLLFLPKAMYEVFRDERKSGRKWEKAFGVASVSFLNFEPGKVIPWDEELPEEANGKNNFHREVREAVLSATKGKTIRKDRQIAAYESDRKYYEKLLHTAFLNVEQAALKAALKFERGILADPHILSIQYYRKNQKTGKDEKRTGRDATAELNYFRAWANSVDFMKAPGEVGEILKTAGKHIGVIQKRTSLISGMAVVFLLVGVLSGLVGAPMVEFLPTVVADLMEQYLAVRIAVLALIALAGVGQMMLGAGLSEEKGLVLIKIVANGVFRLLVGIGCVLGAGSALMTGEAEAPLFLLTGVYFILLGLAWEIESIADVFRARKYKRQAKEDFVKLMDEYAFAILSYLAFHRRWAESCTDNASKKAAEKGVKKLEKTCDYLARLYKKYK